MNIKVSDKVRIVGNRSDYKSDFLRPGNTGQVLSVDQYGKDTLVKISVDGGREALFDEDGGWNFFACDLEVIQ